MKRFLPVILAAPLVAQELTFQRTERDWPAVYAGTSASLVAGAFVPDHVGRSAVLMRGGQAYMSFQPLQFDHFAAVATPAALASTPLLSARQLATLPNHDGTAADRVAAVVAGGVDLWHYVNGQFVSVQGVDAAYAGAVELRSGVHQMPGGAENHFVAFTDTWVQGGVHMADDTIVPGPRIPTPANTTVWDVATVDWVAGGMPEIVVLSSAGLFVLDFLGNSLAMQPFPVVGRGALCAIDQAGTPGVTAVIPTGTGQWLARTWQSGSATTWDSPTFLLPSIPTGIVAAQLTDDSYSEVLVSCTDNLERVMVGTIDGPTWQNGYYIEKSDPSATADHTASILDDIDRDGEPDLIVQSDGGNHLVVIGSVPEQMATFSGLSYNKLPVPMLSSPDMRAVISEDLSVNHSMFASTDNGLLVRFALPAGMGNQMEIHCYQYDMVGAVVLPAVVGSYYATVPPGSSDKDFEMLIPVPPPQHGVVVSRYLEFTLVDNANDAAMSSTRSVFGRYTVYDKNVEASLLIANQLIPGGNLWLLKAALYLDIWEEPAHDPETVLHPVQNSSVHARYVGAYEATDELEGDLQEPEGAPPIAIPSYLIP